MLSINDEQAKREILAVTNEPHVRELITLKTIAETLNQSNDLAMMLDTVVDKLLEVTGLTTGWIFLAEETADFEYAAGCNLPPALLHDDKRPMRRGSCWCLDRFWDGRLKNAVNIMNCKRLDDAEACCLGDTNGITHHATVPLRAGSRRYGVLNVAAPGKEHFTDEELALLQGVAFQIGGAVERMRLHAMELRRADLFTKLGEFTRALSVEVSAGAAPGRLMDRAVELIGAHFDWQAAGIFEVLGDDLVLRTVHAGGKEFSPFIHLPIADAAAFGKAARGERFRGNKVKRAEKLLSRPELEAVFPPFRSASAASVSQGGGAAAALLLIVHNKIMECERIEEEVLEAVAEHIAVALESARLEENRRELARMDERNRLARDLHDSVSQMLFSLSMTAKGVESLLAGNELDSARSAVRDMQSLSKNALKEMRALIMQLRPAGLEDGLVQALKEYCRKLDLCITVRKTGLGELPRAVEEALWRIGQEALNNVSKHAGTAKVEVSLMLRGGEAVLRVADEGRGFGKRGAAAGMGSIGLSTMRERAEALGGTLTISSAVGKGTTVVAAVPLPSVAKRGEQT